ncbi:MAG: hypothetical protein WCY92_15020, partial [Novosphingobium sp.]
MARLCSALIALAARPITIILRNIDTPPRFRHKNLWEISGNCKEIPGKEYAGRGARPSQPLGVADRTRLKR